MVRRYLARFLSWLRSWLLDVFVVLMIGLSGWMMWERYRPSFILVVSVAVPHYSPGENPDVDYIRKINRSANADWSVSILGTTCGGRGRWTYGKSPLRTVVLPLSEYVGNDCALSLPVGEYVMQTCYETYWFRPPDCVEPVPLVVRDRAS